MSPSELVATAATEAVKAVIRALAESGVSEADLDAGMARATESIANIDSAQLAQEAREWSIARGEAK